MAFCSLRACSRTFSLFFSQNCRVRFESLAALIEHYAETKEELEVPLSCTHVNHCYEWEESKVQIKPTLQQKSTKIQSWV